MKKILIFIITGIFTIIIAGCGSSGSGGDSTSSWADNVTGNGSSSGSSSQLSSSFGAAVSKFQTDGDPVSYYNSLVSLDDPVSNPNITPEERLKVRTAMSFARSRMDSTSSNYLDLSSSSAIETIKRDVIDAATSGTTVPEDARVLVASSYLAQTSGNQASNIRSAITEIEKLGTTNGTFDPNFKYSSELGFGVTNADAHALLAQCYFWNGQDTDAEKQLQIAVALDPSLSSSTVRNIKDALELYGISASQ